MRHLILGKNDKIKLRIVSMMLIFGLIFEVTADSEMFFSSAAVTSSSIQQKEAQISAAKKQRQEIKDSITDLEALKKELESQKDDLDAYITSLDASITEIQEKIDSLEEQITAKEEEIEETKEELDEAIEIQEAQYEAMKERIRFMYEKGDMYLLELVLEADSFGDMLNKSEYINKLSEYDQNKLNEYIETTKLIQLTKEALEEEQETLEEAKQEAATEQSNIEALMADKKAELASVNSNISSSEAQIAEYEAQIAAEDATIAALEKSVAADKAALSSARTYDGGMFTWPCPAYTRISDDYGMRLHPTLGVYKMHNGIDLAAPTGSSIRAAYKGVVVAAAYSSSMGNYVMINHGDGLYTIYMHASALYVSVGQEVSAGDNIAAVGSTGRSTGPHLHFAVRLNGSYVSPWNYLK